MNERTVRKDFSVLSGMHDIAYPFSCVFHHRLKDEIQGYNEDHYKSMYAHYDRQGHLASNNCPEENIEIEVVNYIELRDIYLKVRGYSLETTQVEEKFCREMHILPCGDTYYVRCPLGMMDFMDQAKFIAELWAMGFVYTLLTRTDKKVMDPRRAGDRKSLYHDFITTCNFSISSTKLVGI